MGVDAEMLVKTKVSVSSEQVLQWACQLYEAFPSDVFVIPPGNANWPARHCLSIVDAFFQDGPAIAPEDGETFIEVRLAGRYYGPGYERGNAPAIIAIARWLDEVIPDSEIWYGGDSSGILATLFGPQERDALWQHFVKHAHRPYTGYFNRDEGDNIKTPTCELCHIPLVRSGWGGSGKFAAFYCRGCGYTIETHDGGATFGKRADRVA